MNETDIILAVIGSVGLLTTLAVYSRANQASTKYEKALRSTVKPIINDDALAGESDA